ncbi:MAG: ParB N-terminal domain-containing protein, partial [Spirochaetales bacterium]|nr:ParB N-terminal domain-containing protein [Spirochaetales bacterium]
RIRKDNGELDKLAGSISERGLINPITVMENADEKYTLIAGNRRMEACRMLGFKSLRATILTPLAADEALMLEIDENEQRKEFTMSERLEYAEKIKAVELEKAKLRMTLRSHGWETEGVGVCAPLSQERGKVRDIVAKKAGFTSSRQMERAEVVADKRPDLLEKVDSGKTTIFGAYKEACMGEQDPELKGSTFTPDEKLRGVPVVSEVKLRRKMTKEEREAVKHIEEQIVTAKSIEVEMLDFFNPAAVQITGDADSIAGASHDRLLGSPIYAALFEKYTEAVQIANATKGELRSRCESYEKRIRAYEENQRTMERQIAQLQDECAALREEQHAGA